jgi:hypothetical protein
MNERGVSVIEVLVAAFLFAVMVAGVSQLMTSTMSQQQLDIKQELAAIAVNNGAERLLSFIRDHCGSASASGGSEGACDTNGKVYARTYDGTLSVSPIPPELMILCPACRMQINYTCDNSLHIWRGDVVLKDTASNEVFASVNPNILQDVCN